MEPLKVGDLVLHKDDKKRILKIDHIYTDTVPGIPERCSASSINAPEESWDLYTKNLTKAPPMTIAEHHCVLISPSSKIIGDLIKIPGYEAFILIDGKPFQLKKDDNEL